MAAEGGGYGPVTFTVDLGANQFVLGGFPGPAHPGSSGGAEPAAGDHSRTGLYADRGTVRVWVRAAWPVHSGHPGGGDRCDCQDTDHRD